MKKLVSLVLVLLMIVSSATAETYIAEDLLHRYLTSSVAGDVTPEMLDDMIEHPEFSLELGSARFTLLEMLFDGNSMHTVFRVQPLSDDILLMSDFGCLPDDPVPDGNGITFEELAVQQQKTLMPAAVLFSMEDGAVDVGSYYEQYEPDGSVLLFTSGTLTEYQLEYEAVLEFSAGEAKQEIPMNFCTQLPHEAYEFTAAETLLGANVTLHYDRTPIAAYVHITCILPETLSEKQREQWENGYFHLYDGDTGESIEHTGISMMLADAQGEVVWEFLPGGCVSGLGTLQAGEHAPENIRVTLYHPGKKKTLAETTLTRQ